MRYAKAWDKGEFDLQKIQRINQILYHILRNIVQRGLRVLDTDSWARSEHFRLVLERLKPFCPTAIIPYRETLVLTGLDVRDN